MKEIKSFIALGRPIDLSYLTNRLIVFVSLTVFAIYFAYLLLTAVPAAEALSTAFGAGIALFLCWAIGRELDPAYEWSAFFALPLVLAAAFYFGSPDLLSLFFIPLFMRFLNRSPGLRATIIDAVMLVLLGIALYNNGVYTGLPLLLVVFAVDYILEPVTRKLFIFILPACTALALSVYYFNDYLSYSISISLPPGLFILLLVIFLFYVIIATGKDIVPGDNTELQPDIRRINLARFCLVLFIIIEVLQKGENAIVLFYPAAFAIAGAGLYHIFQNIKNLLVR